MNLEFGIWDSFERRRDVSPTDQYRDRITLVQEAEAFGFYGYHVAEHHLSPLSMAPSPLTFLSALAQHTSRIHLGAAVVIVPLYEPIRLAEEICMVDALSGGRLELGVGRGIRDAEHEWFGHDPTKARALFDESLQRIRTALRTGEIEVERPGGGTVTVPFVHAPTQPHGPRFWYVGNLRLAAESGMSVLALSPRREEIDEFHATWSELRRSGSAFHHDPQPMVGTTRPVFIAETDAGAERVVHRSWEALGDNFWATDTRSGGYALPRGTSVGGFGGGDFRDALAKRNLVYGSPATVERILSEFLLEMGPGFNYLVSGFQWGDLTPDEARSSLRLFAEEVAPALRGLSGRG